MKVTPVRQPQPMPNVTIELTPTEVHRLLRWLRRDNNIEKGLPTIGDEGGWDGSLSNKLRNLGYK